MNGDDRNSNGAPQTVDGNWPSFVYLPGKCGQDTRQNQDVGDIVRRSYRLMLIVLICSKIMHLPHFCSQDDDLIAVVNESIHSTLI